MFPWVVLDSHIFGAFWTLRALSFVFHDNGVLVAVRDLVSELLGFWSLSVAQPSKN
jgi:hypothetical protein